jgi:hypothetical protein
MALPNDIWYLQNPSGMPPAFGIEGEESPDGESVCPEQASQAMAGNERSLTGFVGASISIVYMIVAKLQGTLQL